MNGTGTARAAISIVNALPTGIGAAVGIDWPCRVTARLPRSDRGSAVSIAPVRSRTPLVRASAQAALQRFAAGARGLRLSVRSSIPVARGLKSSSAVSSAVVLAAAHAAGAEPDPSEVARLSAAVGRVTGVSATGAFDDAVAGLVPGGVVTDNRIDVELRRFSLEPTLSVALWIPRSTHPASPMVRGRFRRRPALARQAIDAALDGDWPRAMAANSELVESVLGYRYARLRAAVARKGAVASGVSGLGPTFAAIAPAGRMPQVLSALPRSGIRRTVRLWSGEPRSGARP